MKNTVTPVKRDIQFELPQDRIADWHAHGPYVSHFFNTLSVFFPLGERFFIHTVRHFRDDITDPELAQQVAGFIAQEAMHGREHEEYNKKLATAGYDIEKMEGEISERLAFAKRNLPPRAQLAVTIALEHLTAILGHAVLSDQKAFEGSEPGFTRMWKWHAMEETEHKSVAFDVWQKVAPDRLNSYLERVNALVFSTGTFAKHIAEYYQNNLDSDKSLVNTPLARARGYASLAKFMLLKPGGIRKVIPKWFAYFKPGFHPWQDDNSYLLSEMNQIAPEFAEAA